MTALGTTLATLIFGRRVGTDEFGNRYYEHRQQHSSSHGRRKRWVLYNSGRDEATEIPPAWHAWIHYVTDAIPAVNAKRHRWQKSHQPNLTGTTLAYRPAGHFLKGARRAKATGDYTAWHPK